MTFSFWPFRKPKTKLETLQEAAVDILSGAVAGVGSKVSSIGSTLEALPLERIADQVKGVRENAVETLGRAASTISTTASQAKNIASKAATSAAEIVASADKTGAQQAAALIENASDVWHDKTAQLQEKAHVAAQSAGGSAHDAGDLARNTLDNATQAAQESASVVADKAAKTAKSAQQKARAQWNEAPKIAAQSAKIANENLQAARDHATELAALATASLAQWKEIATEKARKSAEHAQRDAQAAADRATEIARAQVEQKADKAARQIAAVSSTGNETARALRDSLAARFTQAKTDAQNLNENARSEAQDAKAAIEVAHDKVRRNRKKADAKRREISSQSNDFVDSEEAFVHRAPQVHVEDATSKWLWIALGALAGAALMLFLAPNEGRRSRALAKDKLRTASDNAAKLHREAARKAADLRNRAEGKLHEVQNAKAEDFADDVTVADRVLTALGGNAATRNLERINVDCADGAVTLRGPMIDEELKAQIETIVRAVKGVREVHAQFLIEDSSEDVFVG